MAGQGYDRDDLDDLLPEDRRGVVHPVYVSPPVSGSPSGLMCYLGALGTPVFRGQALRPLQLAYLAATQEFPAGVILIGPYIDIVALAVTMAFTAEDREWLRGMRIAAGFEFVPEPARQGQR